MTVLKAYDDGTEEWQTIVVGRQGPAGVVQADLPITYDAGTQTVGSDGTIVTSGDVSDIVVLTQAEYDALTPVATTLYIIVG
jgi:hypothetical protein